MKKSIAKYNINIHGLEDKKHEYEFEGDNSFFADFEQDIILGGNFKTFVVLDKTPGFVRLSFDIHSNLNLECDRSLEVFNEEFNTQHKHIYKFGDKAEEISDEIEIIPFGTPQINVAQLIFEYILLQVPMKKLHPKFRNSGGEMVYTDPNAPAENNIEEEINDPRWAALINLKNKN